MKSQKVTFKKSQKLLAENLHVTAVLAIVRTELRAQEASSFCEFWTNDLLRFHIILLFFDSSKRNF